MIMAAMPIIVGGSVLVVPNLFIRLTTLPVDLFVYQVWGVSWLAAGLLLALGLFKLSYNFFRAGLVALTAIYSMFAISGFVQTFVGDTPGRSLFGFFLFATLALISAALLAEPPINPITAVKNGNEEE